MIKLKSKRMKRGNVAIPREKQTLLFQIVIQSLLNLFQKMVRLDQFAQHIRLISGLNDSIVLGRFRHYLAPMAIDNAELAAFFGHLRNDVFRAENGLQVQPSGLHFKPLVEYVLNHLKLLRPFSHLGFHCFDERRAEHCQRLDDMVVKQQLNFINR